MEGGTNTLPSSTELDDNYETMKMLRHSLTGIMCSNAKLVSLFIIEIQTIDILTKRYLRMNFQKTLESVSTDINEVNEWADQEYNKYFSQYFKGEVELYDRMKKNQDPITDQELEWILTELPLELFSVTEQLSKLKTAQEVIKLHIKQTERDYIQNPGSPGSATQKKEDAVALTAEDRLLVTVYDSISERVSRQMSFSKELIMSAKKIWDARRSDGVLNPDVLGKDTSLPEYAM